MADQSNEMVERVARAIAPMMWDGGLCEHLTDQAITVARTAVLRQARAAIEALREPSKQMQSRGSAASYGLKDEVRPSVAGGIFTAMIEAALSHDEVKG
jgi:hypothetical protein